MTAPSGNPFVEFTSGSQIAGPDSSGVYTVDVNISFSYLITGSGSATTSDPASVLMNAGTASNQLTWSLGAMGGGTYYMVANLNWVASGGDPACL